MRTIYRILILISVIALVLVVWLLFPKSIQAPGPQLVSNNTAPTYVNASADVLMVDLPFPGAVVGKTFSVIGTARGGWYFEASFPVEVLDKDGKRLAAVPAQAQSSWMTNKFVPFKADVVIPKTYIGPATLVLHKDNPSGLVQNDASVSFPITIEY